MIIHVGSFMGTGQGCVYASLGHYAARLDHSTLSWSYSVSHSSGPQHPVWSLSVVTSPLPPGCQRGPGPCRGSGPAPSPGSGCPSWPLLGVFWAVHEPPLGPGSLHTCSVLSCAGLVCCEVDLAPGPQAQAQADQAIMMTKRLPLGIIAIEIVLVGPPLRAV